MLDVLYIAISLVVFALMLAFVRACAALAHDANGKEQHRS